MKSEEKLADATQFYESVGLVLSHILGGKKSDESTAPKDGNELEAAMMKVFG